MAGEYLILAFVIIVIGGIGSIRGALPRRDLCRMIDTLGSEFLPDMLRADPSSDSGNPPRRPRVLDC